MRTVVMVSIGVIIGMMLFDYVHCGHWSGCDIVKSLPSDGGSDDPAK